MPSSGQNEGSRHGVTERLSRFWRKFQNRSDDAGVIASSRSQFGPSTSVTNTDASSQPVTSSASLLSFEPTENTLRETTTTTDVAAQTQNNDTATSAVEPISHLEQNSSADESNLHLDFDEVPATSDLWSAAYREAVNSLGKDINVAILKGENVAQLFRQLEEIDKKATQESAFLRGVRYLHSLQVPLETFKLALDLATPLTNIEPTAATVFGIVKSVTAIAISFSTADLEFAKQIGEMLEQISYIDDCDTLGQKADELDIHKALVSVYRKLLEFYNVAFDILSRKGAKLVLKMLLENDRLPNIVKDFLKHAESLQKLVQKATLRIVDDIRALLCDQEISRWLDSTKIRQQCQRHNELRDLRADEACEFLLTDAEFTIWYRSFTSQQLVLLGDMGCGKSVAMNFLIDELHRRNEHLLPQPKICYCYCQNGNSGRLSYIFSALILALLEQLPGLKKTFYEWHQKAMASGIFDAAIDVRKQEEFLAKALETIDRLLFIVIDGLDECDRTSQTSLFKSLRRLSQKTPRLKIILSSRPEEEILEQLYGIPQIYLKCDKGRDRIIVQKTVERQLSYLSHDVRGFVEEELSNMADGSAIWTKMTVDLIRQRNIRAAGPMRTFLKTIPQHKELSELYAELFRRYTLGDSENQKLAMTALKILAVTRRPLGILELAWAVTLGEAQEHVTTVAALAELVDHQRLMALIQPFIFHVDFSDIRKHQVSLVHQSAKEFIMTKLVSTGLDLQASVVSTARDQASLEACILDICIRYLLLDDVGHHDLFSDELLAIEALPQGSDLFNEDNEPSDYDPCCTWEAWEEDMIRYDPADRGFGEFFVYASCCWLDHLREAVPLPGLRSIEDLCQAGSTRLRNWIDQNCRPGCTIKARFLFDSKLYDPLSITALYGSEALLRNMLENSDFGRNQFLPNPVIGAAEQVLQWGDLSRVGILFGASKVGRQLRSLDFFRVVIRQWCNSDKRGHEWDVVFDLIEDVLDVIVQDRWGNELLCIAASVGCMPLIRRLMNAAQHKAELRAELLRGSQREPQPRSFGKTHQSIGEAVLGNHLDVVGYLLEQAGVEAHLQHRNSHGENVLHLASKFCNPAMFQLLVPRFKEGIYQKDDRGDTVLMRIITSSAAPRQRYETTRIVLLQGGGNENGRFRGERRQALRIAAQLGDGDICSLLTCISERGSDQDVASE